MRQRSVMIKDRSQIARVDPTAAGLAPNEMLCLVGRRTADALSLVFAAKDGAIGGHLLYKIFRHFRHRDFRRVTGRAGHPRAAALARALALPRTVRMVFADPAGI